MSEFQPVRQPFHSDSELIVIVFMWIAFHFGAAETSFIEFIPNVCHARYQSRSAKDECGTRGNRNTKQIDFAAFADIRASVQRVLV